MEERSKRSFEGLLVEEVRVLRVKTKEERRGKVEKQLRDLGYGVLEVEKRGVDPETGLNVFLAKVV